MPFVKNFDQLASSPQRKIVLTLIEEALSSIAPENVMMSQFRLEGSVLFVQHKSYDLSQFEHVYVVGLGKGSSGVCKIIENTLGPRLTAGWDIDVVDATFAKISYTKGTHPLPSQTNVAYTEDVLSHVQNLSERDLVLVVICGGGSALFESPTISLPRLVAVNNELLKSGATISEMNSIRKHLSRVKGGGLAEKLYPARVVSMLFSDVLGNDMSVIASGPTVVDKTSLADVSAVVQKFHLQSVDEKDFIPKVTDEKYFRYIDNVIMVSNKTALDAMYQKAKTLGYRVVIFTDRLQGDAKKIGRVLLSETKNNEILLAGGETTVRVTGQGIGGRNQTLVLATLSSLEQGEAIAAFDTDGWDFTTFAGAIGDTGTVSKAASLGLDPKVFLDNDNSTEFFQKTGDGIDTGKLQSNVSDLFIVCKA